MKGFDRVNWGKLFPENEAENRDSWDGQKNPNSMIKPGKSLSGLLTTSGVERRGRDRVGAHTAIHLVYNTRTLIGLELKIFYSTIWNFIKLLEGWKRLRRLHMQVICLPDLTTPSPQGVLLQISVLESKHSLVPDGAWRSCRNLTPRSHQKARGCRSIVPFPEALLPLAQSLCHQSGC